MKIRSFALIAAAVLVFAALTACGAKKPDGIISQLRTDIYEGKTGECEFTAYAEEREIPLAADGKAGTKMPVIIVKICDSAAFYGTYTVTVKIGGKEYSAAPELKADSLMKAVIPIAAPCKEKEIEVSLHGEKEIAATLRSVLPEDVCDVKKAVNKACDALGEKIAYESRKPLGEIFARVLFENGTAYWYVGYINDGTVNAVLVSADGEQVVAEKIFPAEN